MPATLGSIQFRQRPKTRAQHYLRELEPRKAQHYYWQSNEQRKHKNVTLCDRCVILGQGMVNNALFVGDN